VWFSTAPDWEPTATKSLVTADGTLMPENRATTEKFGGGLARIGVSPETAPHDWRTLKELSGMSNKIAQRLYRAAIDCGSRPGHWWGTFDAVPRSKWIAVQVYRNGEWIDVEF
jgi:hypothetical protein